MHSKNYKSNSSTSREQKTKTSVATESYTSADPIVDELVLAAADTNGSSMNAINHALASLAFDAAPDGMLMADADGRIVLVNSASESLLGYGRDELMGQMLTTVLPPADTTSDGYAPGANRVINKSGREVPLAIRLRSMPSDDGLMTLATLSEAPGGDRHQRALEERDRLLATIHERVKSHLQMMDSLLGLQAEQVRDDRAVGALVQCQHRLRAMALIHDALGESGDPLRVDLARTVDGILGNLRNAHATQAQRIQPMVRVDDVRLPMTIAVPLSLIINELCSNVLKHAYAEDEKGPLHLHLTRAGEGYVLEVIDHGRGIPEDFVHEQSSTLGLTLVQLLSEQIDGQLEFQRRNPTRFRLHFIEM